MPPNIKFPVNLSFDDLEEDDDVLLQPVAQPSAAPIRNDVSLTATGDPQNGDVPITTDAPNSVARTDLQHHDVSSGADSIIKPTTPSTTQPAPPTPSGLSPPPSPRPSSVRRLSWQPSDSTDAEKSRSSRPSSIRRLSWQPSDSEGASGVEQARQTPASRHLSWQPSDSTEAEQQHKAPSSSSSRSSPNRHLSWHPSDSESAATDVEKAIVPTLKPKRQLSWHSSVSRKLEKAVSSASSEGVPSDEEVEEVRRFIRQQSRQLSDVSPDQLVADEKRLSRTLREVATYTCGGIMAIEIWVLDEDTGLLTQPRGGWWLSDSTAASHPAAQLELTELNEKSTESVMPGVAVVGMLWSESDMYYSHRMPLVWRDLTSLAVDPDMPKRSRLDALLDTGVKRAVGVPFEDIDGCKGIVVYYTGAENDVEGQKTTTSNNDQLLTHVTNEAYLKSSARYLGASVALTDSRRALVYQQNQHKHTDGKVSDVETAKGDEDEEDETEKVPLRSSLANRVTAWYSKCHGGNLQIPPSMSIRQTCWTIFGCFCGLLVLSGLNEYYQFASDDEYYLLIGPFGALMVLQYVLTGAPAAQPRNVVLGQAVSGAVSLSFTYISESIIPVWLRRALGPAVAIGTMAKLGIPHPPAGAHAVIYASGDFNWTFYCLVVVSSMISVLPATVVNNMSTKRQYPTYWGYIFAKSKDQ